MVKSGNKLYIFILFALLVNCTTENSYVDIDGITIINKEKEFDANIRHNLWTYSQMEHDYLWNEEMPDSSSLDFTTDPYTFFYKLLSSKDRFSWCEINTKGFNPESTVSFDSVYTHNGKKIGYAIYDHFEESADIRGLIIRMKKAEIDELILDIRYNPGGYVSTCCELASFIIPSKHHGKLYQQQYFNQVITQEKINANGGHGADSVFLHSSDWYKTWCLELNRLIVLTTQNTASASEALIMGLRPYIEVITIGTQTCGKNVGSYTIASDDYKYKLQPITFKYYNSEMQTVPDEGLIPDIIVEDDKKYPRGEINEALLQTALKYIDDNSNIRHNEDNKI